MASRPDKPVAADAITALRAVSDPQHAVILHRFFKTGRGEYGEGDRFLGIRVPAMRAIARRFDRLPATELRQLLRSKWHEERALALAIMVNRHRRGDEREQGRLHELYLRNIERVNNWDLVDMSAEHLIGRQLIGQDPSPILDLARSESVWHRRIAMISTFHSIKQGDFKLALRVARMLMNDDHDLIHKAVGWMLREIGNRDRAAEERFLSQHVRRMPRTMLRYAIEKFPERLRRAYLSA